MKKLYFALAMFCMALSASAATPPPKVVFIGDYFTYNWTNAFAANPNWINKGVNGSDEVGQGSYEVLARFQTDVIALHPAIVHIMVGAIDSTLSDSESVPYTGPNFAANLAAMVEQARAANIKVVLGLSPGTAAAWDSQMPQINSIVATYGAANGIEVVNYADALCTCVGALGQNIEVANAFQQMTNSIPMGVGPPGYLSTMLPSTAGYAMMTEMAQTAIANEYLTILTGWLSNTGVPNPSTGIQNGATGLNKVWPDAAVQYTPIGYYSDGVQRPQNNTATNEAAGLGSPVTQRSCQSVSRDWL
jgi:hypothetical protein